MRFLLICGSLDRDSHLVVVRVLLSWFCILSSLQGLAFVSFVSLLMQWVSHLFKKNFKKIKWAQLHTGTFFVQIKDELLLYCTVLYMPAWIKVQTTVSKYIYSVASVSPPPGQ